MNVDCLLITESKLDESIPTNLIKINGFHEPIRRDGTRFSGGCLIYISDKLTFKHKSDLQSEKYQHICADVKVDGKIYCTNVLYRPPNNDTDSKNDMHNRKTRLDYVKYKILNYFLCKMTFLM